MRKVACASTVYCLWWERNQVALHQVTACADRVLKQVEMVVKLKLMSERNMNKEEIDWSAWN